MRSRSITATCPDDFFADDDSFDFRLVDRKGEILGHRLRVVTERVKFNSHSVFSTAIIEGAPEPGWVYFSIRKTIHSTFQVNRSSISRGSHALAVFTNGDFVATVTPGFSSYAIGVRLDLLSDTQDLWPDSLEILSKTAIYEISGNLFATINRELYLIEQFDLPISTLEFRMGDLVTTILACLDEFNEIGATNRQRIIQKSTDYIRNNNRRVSPRELAEVSHCSLRTLQYAFRKTYGISPKKFIDRYRLSQFRTALKNSSDANCLRIRDLARSFGFGHTGNLSRAYRELFGQLPSETPRYDR